MNEVIAIVAVVAIVGVFFYAKRRKDPSIKISGTVGSENNHKN